MINIIYGLKGSGKTQKIVDAANAKAAESKGCVIYITDQPTHSPYVVNTIRFIDIGKYKADTEQTLLAFLEGLLAGNYDITHVFIDSLTKIVSSDASDHAVEEFLDWLNSFSEKNNIKFTVTISADLSLATDGMQKFL